MIGHADMDVAGETIRSMQLRGSWSRASAVQGYFTYRNSAEPNRACDEGQPRGGRGRPSAGPRPRRPARRSGRSRPGWPAAAGLRLRRRRGFGFGSGGPAASLVAVLGLVLGQERRRPFDLLRRSAARPRASRYAARDRGRRRSRPSRPSSFSARASDCRRTNGELSRYSAWPGTVVASRLPVTSVCSTGSNASSACGVTPRSSGR